MEPITSVRTGWNIVSPDDLIPLQIPDQANPPLYKMHHSINISETPIISSVSTERIILLQKVKDLRHKASR